MTFKEIQDAVLADRFNESQRADAKNWINHRYWWIWSLEPWTFKHAQGTGTVTAGSRTVTTPTSFLHAHAVIDSDGVGLRPISDPREFMTVFEPDETGDPEIFTVIAGVVLVAPTPTAGETFTVLFDREYTQLVSDQDTPLLPSGAHFALVHGGAAEGLKLQNDPTWQAFDEDFQASLTVLRQNYLSSVKGAGRQFGAYRPEQWA